MKLELSALVESDLLSISTFIAQDSPQSAVAVVDEIWSEISLIAAQPKLFRIHPEIAPDARMAIVGKYLILFRILNEKLIRIERVFHGSRDLSNLLA
jgi:toxin ParE1/3/4